MAFPTTPTAGQIATMNGIQYTYSTLTNAWTRLGNSGGGNTITTGTISILNTSASTSVYNGALIVQGGVGILGDIQFAGNLYQNGVLFTGASASTTSTFSVLNTSSSTSSSTGALLVSGGVGVRGNMYVGGGLTATTIATLGTGSGSIIGLGVLASQIVQVQGTTPSTSTNSGVLQVSGGVGIASSLFVGSSTYIAYQPPFPVGYGLSLSGYNTQGGAGYFDFLKVTNTTATTGSKSFRLNATGGIEIIESAYTATIFTLDNIGNLTLGGSLTMPARPAFRVYGTGGSISGTSGSPTTVTGSNWTVDFNQGSYLNTTTGVFTAPIAGLYQVNIVARTAANNNASINQIIIIKNTSTPAIMLEWAINTTANHIGGATTIKLAANDTLKFTVTGGSISFDLNDNWSVAYIG